MIDQIVERIRRTRCRPAQVIVLDPRDQVGQSLGNWSKIYDVHAHYDDSESETHRPGRRGPTACALNLDISGVMNDLNGSATVATRTETIYTYVCDLCGSEHHDRAGIRALYVGKPQGEARGMRDRRYQVDVCEDCMARPIADVLAFCAGDGENEGKRSRPRGVVRIAD